MVSSATIPAAAITPAWRMAPPSMRRNARALDEGRRAAHDRADRRAERLAETEADAVAVAGDLGGGHAERDGRVEQARAVDVHRHAVLVGGRAYLGEGRERDHRAAGAVMGGLDT